MRILKQTILTLLFSVFVLSVNAQEIGFSWDKVINAVIKVESNGNPKAKGGNSAGILQITPVLVKECNSILKRKKSKKRYTLADRFNVKKSKEMFILIQETFIPHHNTEKAIRLWNGGPNYSVAKTQKYYQKVMKHYKKG